MTNDKDDRQQIMAHVAYFRPEKSMPLFYGAELAPFELAYETVGQLSPYRDNVVLIHHALSTHSHLCAHAGNPQAGWWQHMVGPDRAIDTNKYYVICINNLGSCFGSTGPASFQPDLSRTYGADFPRLSLVDIVRTQHALLEHLEVTQLHAVIGPSMGGMLSLLWMMLYPQQVQRGIVLSTSMQAYPCQAAIRTLQRDIIRLDPAWQQGQVDDLPGFRLARSLGHLTYRNQQELDQRFTALATPESSDTIHTYLQYNAQKFTRQFDVNSYLTLTQAMDDFHLPALTTQFASDWGQSELQAHVIAVDSDQLFPAWQQQALHQFLSEQGLKSVYHQLDSPFGHDSFLKAPEIAAVLQQLLSS